MPVTFRQIAAQTASVTLNLGADTITIVFYPNKLTEKMIAEINAGVTKDNEMLTELIKEWDIYEDDAHTVMFPVDRINEFGLPFKQQVSEVLAEALRPKQMAPQTNI